MKNKGRTHLAGIGNCKSCIWGITRPITKMGKGGFRGESNKFDKKKWSKRRRGYFKTSHADDIEL